MASAGTGERIERQRCGSGTGGRVSPGASGSSHGGDWRAV